METLTAIVAQLGKKYSIFIPMVRAKIMKHKISHQRYDILCARIMEGTNSFSHFKMTFLEHFLSLKVELQPISKRP